MLRLWRATINTRNGLAFAIRGAFFVGVAVIFDWLGRRLALLEHSAEELEAIKKRWATRGNVMEAPKLIAAKAHPGMALWREHLFAWMMRNAASGSCAC